jgi:uncharacterized protein (TIGR02448 family)
VLFALAGMGSAHAMDVTTQSLVATGYVTSQVTTAPFDRKIVAAVTTLLHSLPVMA